MTAKRERPRRSILIMGKSKTQQNMARECDINLIMKKFENTGLISHVARNPGAYMDLPSGMDFEVAAQLLIDAEANFQALPSKVRKEFDNDPRQFLAFCEDPANRDRMIELGLIDKPPEPAPAPTEPTGGEPA